MFTILLIDGHMLHAEKLETKKDGKGHVIVTMTAGEYVRDIPAEDIDMIGCTYEQ